MKKLALLLSAVLILTLCGCESGYRVDTSTDPENMLDYPAVNIDRDKAEGREPYVEPEPETEETTKRAVEAVTSGFVEVVSTSGNVITIEDQNGDRTSFKGNPQLYGEGRIINAIIYSNGTIKIDNTQPRKIVSTSISYIQISE